MNRFKHFWSLLVSGGLTPVEYRNILPMLVNKNKKMWQVLSVLLSVTFILLYICSLFIPNISDNQILYLITALITTLITVIFWLLIIFEKKVPTILINITIYLLLGVLYFFGIWLGTVLSPNSLSVAFMVMVIAFPLLIYARPITLIIINLLAVLLYILFSYFYKYESLIIVEALNTVTYLIVSWLLIFYLGKDRIKGVLNEFKILQKINIDSLTGLYNEYFYIQTKDEINAKIDKGEDLKLCIVMMDLNNLKKTNDTYGHAFGCAMVVESGRFIKNHFKHSRTFHIGGDEFVAILEGKDFEKREELIASFDEKMKNYTIIKEGISLDIVIARGFSDFESSDNKYDTCFLRADKKMYENKKEIKALRGETAYR